MNPDFDALLRAIRGVPLSKVSDLQDLINAVHSRCADYERGAPLLAMGDVVDRLQEASDACDEVYAIDPADHARSEIEHWRGVL